MFVRFAAYAAALNGVTPVGYHARYIAAFITPAASVYKAVAVAAYKGTGLMVVSVRDV